MFTGNFLTARSWLYRNRERVRQTFFLKIRSKQAVKRDTVSNTLKHPHARVHAGSNQPGRFLREDVVQRTARARGGERAPQAGPDEVTEIAFHFNGDSTVAFEFQGVVGV